MACDSGQLMSMITFMATVLVVSSYCVLNSLGELRWFIRPNLPDVRPLHLPSRGTYSSNFLPSSVNVHEAPGA
jgi:hypothetical protein